MTDAPEFEEAVENGIVVEKDNWHRPNSYPARGSSKNCYCTKTTEKGAYKDVTVQYDGLVIHYYHQSPVAVELPNGGVRVDNCGYQTKSTKQRLNRYLPSGYEIYKQDGEWILSTPNGEREFRNRDVLHPQEDVQITVHGPA